MSIPLDSSPHPEEGKQLGEKLKGQQLGHHHLELFPWLKKSP